MAASAYDIVVVGDFRFPGGTSTAIASELKAQAAAGYRTGLIQVSCPLLRYPHAMHGEIRALLDAGRVEQLDPEARHEARLAIAHHPALFLFPPRRTLAIAAPTRILVAHHPPATARGTPYYDVAAVDTNASELLGGEVIWAPVGPAVRAQLDGGRAGPSLLAEDWCNVIDADEWHCARAGPRGNRPVIGRHSCPQREKWPATRDEVLAVYPTDPTVEVRILGADSFLEELVGGYPSNWEVLPFDAETPAKFLSSLDFFVYFHHPDWIEAFGRTVLEALASGAVAILPESFRQTFGEAAIYAEPGDVASLAKRLHADAKAWRRQSERGSQAVRSRFSLERHRARVAAIVGGPHRTETSAARPQPVAPVLFVASNGIGMGHLTRQLAIARRAPASIRPTFATLSQGMAVI
ncbi:MAG: glycosyltransferase, partial [Burkholderiales bacterium]